MRVTSGDRSGDSSRGKDLDSQHPRFVRSHNAPSRYYLMRAAVRFWIRLFLPRLRVLNQEKLQHPGPAILVITHPQSLPVALLLVATIEYPVGCLLPAGQIGGIFGKLAAWALGIKVFESLSAEGKSPLNPCLSLLTNQGIIAVFAEPFPQKGGSRAAVADFVASLALETIVETQDQAQPALHPIHWFLGAKRRRSERLMYVGGPIQAHHFLPKVGEDVAQASLHLAETVQKAISANIFSLAEPELEKFSFEMEDFSREQLRQQWSARPDWKQQPEELHLSRIASRWFNRQNRTDPARLVEFRESLDEYREEQRRSAMRQLVVESSGPWQASGIHLAAAWFESVVGLPVALYGLVNHLPAGIVLLATGFRKSSPQRDPKAEWLVRIFVVLSFYTIQVFLANHWWGRAAAGYYALTLPVSGAYLWRYRWLLHHRVHVLLLKALQPFRSAQLARKRDEILRRFNCELERSVQSVGMPYGRSPDPAE
jgi:hypothetical protein